MKLTGGTQRCRGTLRMWDDDKGFGFLEPDGGGPDVFLHIKSLANRAVRPAIGATVSYRCGVDDHQRPQALEARLEKGAGVAFQPVPPKGRTPSASPRRFGQKTASFWSQPRVQAGAGAAAFIGCIAGAAALGLIESWIPALYAVASSVTFATYVWDKTRAEQGSRRVPENTLHLLEALGGWPGALLAQHWLHHKTAKVAYQVIFWLIVATHLGLWGWLTLGRSGA